MESYDPNATAPSSTTTSPTDTSAQTPAPTSTANNPNITPLGSKLVTIAGKPSNTVSDFVQNGTTYYGINNPAASPIYQDDHQNLIAFGIKAGFITGESAIEQLPFQHKDILLERLKEKEKQQQAMLQSLPPEERIKVLTHQGHGSRH